MTLRRPASRQARLALCLVVMLGNGTVALAQPQDPGRPYWSDNWRGWHFYEEPEVPPPEPPASAPRQAAPASSAALIWPSPFSVVQKITLGRLLCVAVSC